MPLRAIDAAGANLHAFEFEDAAWARLKEQYRQLGLRMPCCETPAIPKTSPRGTCFFAHVRRGQCATAPESDEHLYCKFLIARAAQRAGWTVTTECRGQTPAGEKWIADIMCEKGTARVALEVQMSPQTDEVTRYRQERYLESGVRASWFFSCAVRPEPIRHDQALPTFRLSPVAIGHEPWILDFERPLSEFVEGMLTRRLRWSTPDRTVPVHVEYMKDTCWACKNPVKQVYGHITGMQVGDEPPERWIERYYTPASMSQDLETVLGLVTNSQLQAAGLNTVMKQSVIRGKPTGWPYCNRCLHCGAPQNNHHVGQLIRHLEQDSDGGALLGLEPILCQKKLHGRWEFD